MPTSRRQLSTAIYTHTEDEELIEAMRKLLKENKEREIIQV